MTEVRPRIPRKNEPAGACVGHAPAGLKRQDWPHHCAVGHRDCHEGVRTLAANLCSRAMRTKQPLRHPPTGNMVRVDSRTTPKRAVHEAASLATCRRYTASSAATRRGIRQLPPIFLDRFWDALVLALIVLTPKYVSRLL